MRFDPYLKLWALEEMTAITPRRIAGAQGAITRKYNQMPPMWRQLKELKGDPKETARERVARINEQRIRGVEEGRSERAAAWRHARKVRRGLPFPVIKMFDCLYKDSSIPGTPSYALDLMNTLIRFHYGFEPPNTWWKWKCEKLNCKKCDELMAITRGGDA